MIKIKKTRRQYEVEEYEEFTVHQNLETIYRYDNCAPDMFDDISQELENNGYEYAGEEVKDNVVHRYYNKTEYYYH